MIHTSTSKRDKAVFGKESGIHWQSKQIGLLYHDEQSTEECWDTLEDLREEVLDHEGQYIALDLADPLSEPFTEMLYATLKNSRWERSLSFSLPVILQHNPRVASPFLNRAILWQRLCDIIIVDDDSYRKTVLVLENVDEVSPAVQHDIARLIRFHETHGVHRSFVFTLNHSAGTPTHIANGTIIPELQEILGI